MMMCVDDDVQSVEAVGVCVNSVFCSQLVLVVMFSGLRLLICCVDSLFVCC